MGYSRLQANMQLGSQKLGIGSSKLSRMMANVSHLESMSMICLSTFTIKINYSYG